MAQKKQMETRDLVGFDSIVSGGEKIKAYFEENARQIIAVSLIICLAAGATAYWTISSRAAAQTAQSLLNTALNAMNSMSRTEAEQEAVLSTAIASLNRAVESYGSTEAGQAALFYRGRCKSLQKDYAGAIEDYTNFLTFSGPMAEQLGPFALENLGYANEALGNHAEALGWFEKAVQSGRSAALLGMARMHEAAGSGDLACECYRKYLADQNESGYRDFVEMKIGSVCG
jgi:tetratricopeptide (TPR) repeat protein